jgi:hypothetical protein
VTDETEPKPSEEKPPADVPDVESKPTPVAYTTDVVSVGSDKKRDDDDDDESDVDEEPSDASRLSPFAVASFVVSLLALYQAPRDVFTAQGLSASVFWRYILPTMFVPLGASLTSLYLAMRASEEVFVGRLGGVGFLHAARVISALVLLVCIGAAVLVLFFSEAPVPQQFG